MSDHALPTTRDAALARRPWTLPALVPLPPLEQLTLQTGAVTGTCSPSSGCTFSFLPASDAGVRRG